MRHVKTGLDRGKNGNNRLSSPLRNRMFVFTINNWDISDTKTLQKLGAEVNYLVYGEEVGDEGTPHLQGYVEFKIRKTLKYVRDRIPGHIEIARNVKAAKEYCKKDGIVTEFNNNLSKIELRKKNTLNRLYKDVVWKDWQQNIIDVLQQTPDDRKIYWFWEPTGNVGKSFLTKYLWCIYEGFILAEGKKDNIFNNILSFMENGGEPSVIVLDLPRTSVDFVSYPAIEKIKNGFFYSGKYEGGMCEFAHPHVIVFANSPPKRFAISVDRWEVIEI